MRVRWFVLPSAIIVVAIILSLGKLLLRNAHGPESSSTTTLTTSTTSTTISPTTLQTRSATSTTAEIVATTPRATTTTAPRTAEKECADSGSPFEIFRGVTDPGDGRYGPNHLPLIDYLWKDMAGGLINHGVETGKFCPLRGAGPQKLRQGGYSQALGKDTKINGYVYSFPRRTTDHTPSEPASVVETRTRDAIIQVLPDFDENLTIISPPARQFKEGSPVRSFVVKTNGSSTLRCALVTEHDGTPRVVTGPAMRLMVDLAVRADIRGLPTIVDVTLEGAVATYLVDYELVRGRRRIRVAATAKEAWVQDSEPSVARTNYQDCDTREFAELYDAFVLQTQQDLPPSLQINRR
jgi:hypothetical protein